MRAHPPEIKAQVLAALLAGQSVTQTAKDYDLNKSVVSRWRKAMSCDTLQLIATEKERTLDELLLEHVQENLKALSSLAKTFGNPEWSKRQGAAELGVVFGIVSDKTVRILAALEPEEPVPYGGIGEA